VWYCFVLFALMDHVQVFTYRWSRTGVGHSCKFGVTWWDKTGPIPETNPLDNAAFVPNTSICALFRIREPRHVCWDSWELKMDLSYFLPVIVSVKLLIILSSNP